ncbi:hypothetical protein NA57DRAFT_53063 [Rhizodiscina lignyota]|uniref:Uncharacterized protein n=1 Tax=Rhizodiscina lignyota TaxID=1504668 RepID=A0A9P4IQL5_9PEZI|nr:hypothetical protein NA57DRAFT_53063 [Rhizodiscina lignyota]
MGLVRYTHEQLLKLQESPLVRKPDGLPSIAQWMESETRRAKDAEQLLTSHRVPQTDQKDRKQPRQSLGRNDEQESGEPITQRNFFQTRQMGKAALYVLYKRPDITNTIAASEELLLGKFPMPRHQIRNRDSDKPTTPDDEGANRPYNRWSRTKDDEERPTHLGRERSNMLNLRGDKDDEGEGWATVKPRKSFGHEDGERWQRNGDRIRDKFTRNAEGDQDVKRNGAGRGRFDKPWHRDNGEQEPRSAGGRTGGWRDKERQDNREWVRGGRMDSRVEEDPEWMDETPKDESAHVRTAADMEKFKQMMKDQAAGGGAKLPADSPVDKTKQSPSDMNITSPLSGIDGGGLFGRWGEAQKTENRGANGTGNGTGTGTGIGTGAIKPATKVKASKFSSFFGTQKDEDVREPEQPFAQAFAQQLAPASAPAGGEPNDADKEGFNKILAMLSGANIASPPPAPTAGPQPPSMPTRTPIDLQSPEALRQDMRRQESREEPGMFFPGDEYGFGGDQYGHQNQHRPQNKNHEPPGLPPQQDFPSQDYDFGLFSRRHPENAPSRNGAGSARAAGGPFGPPEPQGGPKMDPNHEFLLNLMQSRATPLQRQEPITSPSDLNNNFVFPENKVPKQPHPQPQQQKMRAPPPGFPGMYDERQHMFELEQQRQREMDNMPELGRKPSNRAPAPPGFFDDPAIAGLQRRNTTEATSRQPQQQHMTNMGIPRQMPPQQEDFFMKAQPPPGMRPPNMPEGMGLPPGVRLPPGFGPPPQGPPPNLPHTIPNTPLGHPGMQRMPPGMFPPGMPPPPQYFGGPGPGFGGPMGPPPPFGGPIPPGRAVDIGSCAVLVDIDVHCDTLPSLFTCECFARLARRRTVQRYEGMNGRRTSAFLRTGIEHKGVHGCGDRVGHARELDHGGGPVG